MARSGSPMAPAPMNLAVASTAAPGEPASTALAASLATRALAAALAAPWAALAAVS